MNMKEKELFEKREAAYMLAEKNELAIIELTVKLEMLDWFQLFLIDYECTCKDVDLTNLYKYVGEQLKLRTRLQLELLHEKSKYNDLQSKREVLWQT